MSIVVVKELFSTVQSSICSWRKHKSILLQTMVYKSCTMVYGLSHKLAATASLIASSPPDDRQVVQGVSYIAGCTLHKLKMLCDSIEVPGMNSYRYLHICICQILEVF